MCGKRLLLVRCFKRPKDLHVILNVAVVSWLVRDNREPGSGIQQKASLLEFIKVDFY